ncbi:YlzJ-like family protein [Salirhabdus sp. Marseille-P4669]|uniref:YlzJ-like family protein n=1 Tax=Salirhabdus sp. Marseille-P4669 TaxID=2042310 RepID=UPI000C7D6F72|nr:YlzJ-like family protein [Salirhabdus sp. Marseille-P4669]
MILYTPLSMDDIFPEDEREYEKHKWINVEGKMMKVYDHNDGTVELTQMISTNPNDYLDTRYMPGSRLKL